MSIRKVTQWLTRLSNSVYARWISVLLVIAFGLPSVITYWQAREPVDISGQWRFDFKVIDSSYHPYLGITSSYKVFFEQKSQVLDGKGESWEFESPLDFDAHRPIAFEGKIVQRKIVANYTLHGKQRISYGTVELEVNRNGDRIEGDFVGTGADARGRVSASRL